MQKLKWRLLIVLAVFITAGVYVLPTIITNWWPHKKINLGLDLQGGMHLVLEVDTQQAVESTIERIAHDLRSDLKKKDISHKGIRVDNARISIELNDKDAESFKKLMDADYRDLRMEPKHSDNQSLVYQLDFPEVETLRIKKMAVEQALETIRNRIDQFGVSEPDIRIQGDNRILIQLPGIKDTHRAKELIGKTALLEFKLVDEDHDLDSALKNGPPPGSTILYEEKDDPKTGRKIKNPFLIKKRTSLTGATLTDAKVQIDAQYNEPYVSIKFDNKGARDFAKVTEENIKKRLAIVLDNNVYSAPVIQDKISGGEARITGNFSMEEAHDLAIVLRAGALPAPVNILEERTVGPSLGADSINQGLLSMCVGGFLVVVLVMVYYKFAGFIADVALFLNLFLIAAGLAAFQATLTLPGIAGIILTIGMAVDGNVLIYERIREELKLGKTPRAAVDIGYSRATLTILDANITTLISAVVLFQFGTGPVKGFAVTLSLGVIASMFTAIVMTRLAFDYMILNRNPKKLSI